MSYIFKNVKYKLLSIALCLICTKSYATGWRDNLSYLTGNYFHYCNNTYRNVGYYEPNPQKFWQVHGYTSLQACTQDWTPNGKCREGVTRRCTGMNKLVSPHERMWKHTDERGRRVEQARQRNGHYNFNFGKITR